MIRKNIFKILFSVLLLLLFVNCISPQNPILQTLYTTDLSPVVFKDTPFIYTGNEEEGAPAKG